jgi:hypothetical protein
VGNRFGHRKTHQTEKNSPQRHRGHRETQRQTIADVGWGNSNISIYVLVL